jgi:hypothetical protein
VVALGFLGPAWWQRYLFSERFSAVETFLRHQAFYWCIVQRNAMLFFLVACFNQYVLFLVIHQIK